MQVKVACPYYVAAALLEASRLYYKNQVTALVMLGLMTSSGQNPIPNEVVFMVMREGRARSKALWKAERDYMGIQTGFVDEPRYVLLERTAMSYQTCTGKTLMIATYSGFEMERQEVFGEDDERQAWWSDLAKCLDDDEALQRLMSSLISTNPRWGHEHAGALRDVVTSYKRR